MHGLSRRLARVFWPHQTIRAVHCGPCRGMRYVVSPAMGVSYAFGRGTYNFAFLKSKVKRGMTVYDIGANAGQVALFFSKVVGAEGSVFAFEPIAKNILPYIYEDWED